MQTRMWILPIVFGISSSLYRYNVANAHRLPIKIGGYITRNLDAETKWLPIYRRHFKCILLNQIYYVLIAIPMEFVHKDPINKMSELG